MSSHEQAGGVSSEAVAAKTGKDWLEWFAILDAAGAQQWDHKQIVAYLDGEHGVGPWWRQTVTVGYERSRGLRDVYQKPGGYAANGSKTVNVPVAVLFQAWADESLRSRWFPDFPFTVRKATPSTSMRLGAADGALVGVSFWDKGPGKSQVSLDHSKLAGPEAAADAKAMWAEKLAQLQAFLESAG